MKIIRKMSTDQTYILKLGVNTLAWSGLLAFFLCSFRGAEGELPEQQMINMYLAIAAVIIAGLGVSSWRIVHRERHKPVHRESFLSIAWMIFCAVLAAVGMEYICNPSFKSLSLHYLLWNIYYSVWLFLVLWLIFNSSRIAVAVGSVFYFIWAVAAYFVQLFRGQPLQLIDIKSVGTAMDVVAGYDFVPTKQMVFAGAVVGCIIISSFFEGRRKIAKSLPGKIGARAGGVVLLTAGILFIRTYDMQTEQGVVLDRFTPALTYQTCGNQVSFYTFAQDMIQEKPEDYNAENLGEITAGYTQSDSGKNQVKPHIIAIMNESFTDVTINGEYSFNFNVPYLQNLRAIQAESISGNLLVSTFGGGTAKSEYEFLTGNSMMELPAQAVPYMQYYTHTQPSLVSTLEDQGYETLAIHPGDYNSWRRDKAYAFMGFDDYLYKDDFEGMETLRGYVTDQACYQKVMECLREDNGGMPKFIFNVTIQNHGGYGVQDMENTVRMEGQEDERVNQYLTLTQRSDDALGWLINELRNYPEPVLVVFCGDHWPNLDINTLNGMIGTTEEQRAQDPVLANKLYTVPYFIWANYSIEHISGQTTSLNYLGSMMLEQTGLQIPVYNQYLRGLRAQIPAINYASYITADGVMHTIDEENEWKSVLNGYSCLQYNNLFDYKHLANDIFYLQNP